MPATYLDCLKYRYKSNKFLKIRLILTNFCKSGHIFLFCKNGVHLFISYFVRAWRDHVSPWHKYLRGWDLILFLLSCFLLKMVSVINELHCQTSNDCDMIQLQNQQFTNNTLHKCKCSTELLVFSKGVLKNFTNFTGEHPWQVWFIM